MDIFDYQALFLDNTFDLLSTSSMMNDNYLEIIKPAVAVYNKMLDDKPAELYANISHNINYFVYLIGKLKFGLYTNELSDIVSEICSMILYGTPDITDSIIGEI